MSFRTKYNLSKLFSAAVLLLLLFSCNNADKNKSSSDLNKNDPMYSEAISIEAFTLSWDLMQEGQIMANNGSTSEEIINTFPEGTMFQTNESSILFFMEGSSSPMLIELIKDELNETNGNGNPVMNQQKIQFPNIITNVLSGSMINESDKVDVVASQKGEDNRQDKKALIISPYYDDWGYTDDGPKVKRILEKNRNYKRRIDYLSNDITLEHFKNFGKYDIVHISTHGKNYCGNIDVIVNGGFNTLYNDESEECRTLLSSGVEHGFENAQEAFDFVANSGYNGLIVVNTERFWLRSSFFDHFYGSGLKNKIWYFAACEMGMSSDLSSTMNKIHKDGHFFYWSNIVYGEDAVNAAELFYSNLITKGLDAKKAFEKIPSKSRNKLRSHRVVMRDSIKINREAKTTLLHTQSGNSQHGIEVIELRHPEENRTLEEGDLYPIVGDFGDGIEEALTLDVRLIGYTQAQFEEKQMSLSLKVDDKTVLNKKTFLPDQENDEIEVKPIKGKEYGVQVKIKDIAIPDLGDKKEITLKAYLYFDGKKFSIHKEKVKLKAEGILAELKNGNETVYFYYDDENKTMRMESSESDDSYFDKDGYFYFFNTEGNEMMPYGWIKNKSMASMFMGNYSFKPVEGDAHINDNAGQFNFPMIAWALNYRAKHYEQNSNFKKQKINCDKPKKCTKFIGTSGQEAGHYVIFNPGGRLIEMGQGNFSVKYTYGYYGVQLPSAQEVSLPFNFN